MKVSSKIYVAGHTGLVGSAVLRRLQSDGYKNIVTCTHREVDLINQHDVRRFFHDEKPEYVFMCAAKVGGVLANSKYKADFIYQNLMIQSNIIHSAYKYDARKLLFLGSNCLYPKLAAQPIKEEYLMAGKLEPTTEAYAVAKIAGIKMCQAYREQYGCNFISALPVNIYGPGDNYREGHSHVIAGLLSRFHKAKLEGEGMVKIWGTGAARREFLHVDDLAAACIFLMLNYDGAESVNIGSGEEISIRDLALMIGHIVGYMGAVEFDPYQPDGILSKLLDSTKINKMGWGARIPLADGLKTTYSQYSA